MWFNSIVAWVLRSPFHKLMSRGTMLVTVSGRRSGKAISTPTNFLQDDNTLWVISWRERTWWRNLREGAEIQVLLSGETLNGGGLVIEEQNEVAASLSDYLCKAPHMARYLNIKVDKSNQPDPTGCEQAASKMVMVRIDLEEKDKEQV